MRPPLVLLVGISGVGKGWMLSQAQKRLNLQILSASKLISDGLDAGVRHDDLRKRHIPSNQSVLVDNLQQRIDSAAPIVVLDAHVVIDTPVGLEVIPDDVFEAIAPDLIIFLTGCASGIVENRLSDTTRDRPVRTVEELTEHITLACRTAKNLSVHLEVPMTVIEAGDVATFCGMLAEHSRGN